MDYSFLDRNEYKHIPVMGIDVNRNGLPFFITKMDYCNERKHRHEFVQIIYMCKGKLKHVINNNIFDVYKGDIFVIPPYVPHYYINESDSDFEIIEFEFIPEYINDKFALDVKDSGFMDFAYLEPFLVSEHEIKPRLNLSGSLQEEVEDLFDKIMKEYEERDDDFELSIKALLLRLLVIVGRRFKKDVDDTEEDTIFLRHRSALSEAVIYINQNFEKDIEIGDAARVAMLSQSYFRYMFKQMTGKTFTEYVNNLKVNRAIELLKVRHDLKVVDICYEVGFNSINHFNRIFRQETGVTPLTFRKSGKKQ